MLDLHVHKGRKFAASSLFDVAIHVKPTSQAVPLCHTSWHQPSIHLSWPISRCIHYYKCCTSKDSYRHALANLISRISSSDPSHPSLADLHTNFAHGTLIRRGSGNGKRANGGRSSKCTRVILPWHPGLSCLNGILRDQFHDSFIEAGFADYVPIVTWRLGAPNIHSRILKDTRFKFSSGRS